MAKVQTPVIQSFTLSDGSIVSIGKFSECSECGIPTTNLLIDYQVDNTVRDLCYPCFRNITRRMYARDILREKRMVINV